MLVLYWYNFVVKYILYGISWILYFIFQNWKQSLHKPHKGWFAFPDKKVPIICEKS